MVKIVDVIEMEKVNELVNAYYSFVKTIEKELTLEHFSNDEKVRLLKVYNIIKKLENEIVKEVEK